jgi:succinate dehydrogenase / fumarate reductase cytochrome b subunit
MDRNKPRPVFFNLFQIHLPIGGVISIIHRISGILLVLSLPVFLYLLDQSLESEESFQKVAALLASMTGKVFLLVWSGLLAQHFFSGLRHMLIDLDIGVEKQAARNSAWATPVLTIAILIVLGIAIW